MDVVSSAPTIEAVAYHDDTHYANDKTHSKDKTIESAIGAKKSRYQLTLGNDSAATIFEGRLTAIMPTSITLNGGPETNGGFILSKITSDDKFLKNIGQRDDDGNLLWQDYYLSLIHI